VARHRVAVLTQSKFLYSQRRHSILSSPVVEAVIILSRRPSMPPGKMLIENGEAWRKGGSMDFQWIVFNRAGFGMARRPAQILWTL
jgi:hypothetical protein